MNEQGERVVAGVDLTRPLRRADASSGTYIEAEDGEDIAVMLCDRRERSKRELWRRAYADLFAAAPDLLAACETLSARMDSFCRSGIVPDHLDKRAMEQARAAIAKATGGAQ